MNSESGTAPKSRNSRFIPFFLIILCAVAIGFAIRYFIGEQKTPSNQGGCEVYFSEVNGANSGFSLEKLLVIKLSSATMKIDAALYHLDSKPVADALIKAHNRDVKVQVFTENDNAEEQEIQRLLLERIPVRDDGDNEGYMHHKFIVVDERYVWTGSYNTTYNGAYKNNNNAVWIDSEPLADNFTQEFREMFLSGQFGKSSDPYIPYPQITLSDGTTIFTYFAPENDTISPLLKEITSAEKSIYFMAFSFTHDKLGEAIRNRFMSEIAVEGVFDENQITKYSEYTPMKELGMQVKIDETPGTMHHKVIIIDEETVVTGSYNFSRNAETQNSENLLIIKGNKDIARAYLDEFNKLYNVSSEKDLGF